MDDVPSLPTAEANDRVLELLDPIGPRRVVDPYLGAGCHPDVVERVWDRLGPALSKPCRFMADGRHPVLAHPTAHVIFAFTIGTAYALWLSPVVRDDAGPVKTVERWSNGTETDLVERLGDGWACGTWDDREFAWCQAALAWWDREAS